MKGYSVSRHEDLSTSKGSLIPSSMLSSTVASSCICVRWVSFPILSISCKTESALVSIVTSRLNHFFGRQISRIVGLAQQSFRSALEPLLLQVLDPRDERAFVFEEKIVEVIGICLALTKQRPQFP